MYCNVKRPVKILYSETVCVVHFPTLFLCLKRKNIVFFFFKYSLDHIEKGNYLYLTVNKRRDKTV